MFDTLQRLGQLQKWGNPWHGRFEQGGLRLPNGDLQPYKQPPPANAPEAYLVRFDGIPPAETSEEQAALGLQWRADAVLYTLEKRYAPNSDQGFGYDTWLWRSPVGEVWCLRLEFIWAGSSLSVGASTNTPLKVWARRLGRFDAEGQEPLLDEFLLLEATLAWSNRGPSTQIVFPHLSHSPTGDRTALTMRTGPLGWRAVPKVTSVGAREAMVAAGRGSALFELQVIELSTEGLPVLQLQTIVDSASARENDSGTSPATPRFEQVIINRQASSTTAGDWPAGVSGETGWATYGQRTTPSTYPTNSFSTQEQLICGLYDEAGVLRQLWYRRHQTDTYEADEPGNVDYVRSDFTYSYLLGTSPREYLTGQRDMPAFTMVSLHSRSQMDAHELLLDGVVLDRQTRETYSHRRFTVSYAGHSLSNPPPWDPGPSPGFPINEFVQAVEEVGEVRVNGIPTATGTPNLPSTTVLDPVRHAWADFPPRILSSHVAALCPRRASPATSWVETVCAVDGGTFSASAPQECGPNGHLASPSWDPRSGALHLAINKINGFV